jgi:hypothetical protein
MKRNYRMRVTVEDTHEKAGLPLLDFFERRHEGLWVEAGEPGQGVHVGMISQVDSGEHRVISTDGNRIWNPCTHERVRVYRVFRAHLSLTAVPMDDVLLSEEDES